MAAVIRIMTASTSRLGVKKFLYSGCLRKSRYTTCLKCFFANSKTLLVFPHWRTPFNTIGLWEGSSNHEISVDSILRLNILTALDYLKYLIPKKWQIHILYPSFKQTEHILYPSLSAKLHILCECRNIAEPFRASSPESAHSVVGYEIKVYYSLSSCI